MNNMGNAKCFTRNEQEAMNNTEIPTKQTNSTNYGSLNKDGKINPNAQHCLKKRGHWFELTKERQLCL